MYRSFTWESLFSCFSHVDLPTPNRNHELVGKIARPNGITFQSNGKNPGNISLLLSLQANEEKNTGQSSSSTFFLPRECKNTIYI